MYQIMFYAGLACTFLFLVASIILFVKNDVGKRIGDITGANARKAMKELNSSRELAKKESVYTETSKILIQSEQAEENLKDRTKSTQKKEKKRVARRQMTVEEEATDVLAVEDEATDVLPGKDEVMQPLQADEKTSLLIADEATDILSDEATDILTDEETELLAEGITETLAKDDATELLYDEVNISAGGFDSILNGATDLEVAYTNDSEQTDVLSGVDFGAIYSDDISEEDEYTQKLTSEELQHTEENLTTVLSACADNEISGDDEIISEEILPMPDIFQVEEDITIVHTEDKI